ncbi:hypothetical protein CC80DRAFT_406620, partial [Byssothecium circinans]
ALRKDLPFTWNKEEVYDTVNPFGDPRQGDFESLWTFDIDNDTLLHTNRYRRTQISLALLRDRPVTLADMTYLGPPVPSPVDPTAGLTEPYWKPQVQVEPRIRAFAHRILCDFNHQWRHILRSNYNTITLRVLARAIIRLSTLRFDVHEETGSRHGTGSNYVWITRLPWWEPFQDDIIPVGDVYVVVCPSIQEGISMVQEHSKSHTEGSLRQRERYMVLSVKHIMLCRATGPDKLEYTAPEPLFNGNHSVGPPSVLALDYLLWATASCIPSISTPLQLLPIEIQDIILSYASAGTVAAARIGCLLGIGSPFLWMDGPLRVCLMETCTIRPVGVPVESQAWIDDKSVGIVYRGRN